jgi:hypothetical protein
MLTHSNTPVDDFEDHDPCGSKKERSSTPLEHPLDPCTIKEQVKNYQKAFETLGVPPDFVLQGIPINIQRIKDLIDRNEDNLDGIRLYFSKKSADPYINNDYQLTLVPCTFDGSTYQDKISADANAFISTSGCKIPPGCRIGAGFLDEA